MKKPSTHPRVSDSQLRERLVPKTSKRPSERPNESTTPSEERIRRAVREANDGDKVVILPPQFTF